MNKAFLSLLFTALFLSSCQTASEREKVYRADYYNYSCPQLYQKYSSIKQRYQEERTARLALNTASSMMEILDPANPQRVTRHNYSSGKEYDYEIQMKAIENLAIDKNCEGVSF